MVAARSRRAFSSSVIGRATRRCGTPGARSASVSGPSPATHSTASRSRPAERVEQHRESLARLVAADEQHRRPWRRPRCRLRRSARGRRRSGRISSPPNASSALRWASAETAVRIVRLRDHRAAAERSSASYHAFRPGARRGTCRPSGRSVPTSAAWFAPGDERLVQVQRRRARRRAAPRACAPRHRLAWTRSARSTRCDETARSDRPT